MVRSAKFSAVRGAKGFTDVDELLLPLDFCLEAPPFDLLCMVDVSVTAPPPPPEFVVELTSDAMCIFR